MLILTASNGHNLRLAELVAEHSIGQGHSATLIDLVDLDLPLYTPISEKTGSG